MTDTLNTSDTYEAKRGYTAVELAEQARKLQAEAVAHAEADLINAERVVKELAGGLKQARQDVVARRSELRTIRNGTKPAGERKVRQPRKVVDKTP